MRHALLFILTFTLALSACKTAPDYGRPLPPGAPALIPLGPEDPVPDLSGQWNERMDILPALENSITWTKREHAKRFYPQAGIDYDRALASLERLRQLLLESAGPAEFQAAVVEEFTIYKSAGWDGRGGGVLYTAYCTPILEGRLKPGGGFDYPLYGLPPDLVKGKDGEILGWETAMGRMPNYPSRAAIEAGSLLEGRGLELVWLSDPIDAYLAHVNGSAFIRLGDGSMFKLGYAGKNGRPYTSLGRELEADRKIPRGEASLKTIREWAASASEEEVKSYLHRNASFVFFTPIDSNPHGSLDFEVIGGRSLATDKTLFPRGAAVFVETKTSTDAPVNRIFFDQDTGGAIRTAGRADIYIGVGDEAEETAGQTKVEGQLYYLFLKR